MQTRISIAMATYNGEKYLPEQLESLVKQTVLPYELVICDDCSQDATANIIRDFAASAPFPVRAYINEVNLGFSDNFLKAAGLCSGGWIAFCDQDDIWFPDKIKRLCQFIERHDNDELVLVGHSSLIANASLEPTGQRRPNFQQDKYINRESSYAFSGINGFSMVFRASLIKECDPSYRPRIAWDMLRGPPGHDHWISTLANAVGDMGAISDPLAIWRRHGGAATWCPTSETPQSSIGDLARGAMMTFEPDPYIFRAMMAKETAEAFEKIGQACLNQTMKQRLLTVAPKFYVLADIFFQRGELYTCRNLASRLRAFAKLLWMNAYFGPPFRSLGWRSLLKDSAFAVGLIGRTEGE